MKFYSAPDILSLQAQVAATVPRRERIRSRKNAPKVFKCGYTDCGLPFVNKFNLKRHILSKHTTTKMYSCSFCQEEFSLKQYLDDHLSKRNKVKKSPCAIRFMKEQEKLISVQATTTKTIIPDPLVGFFDSWTNSSLVQNTKQSKSIDEMLNMVDDNDQKRLPVDGCRLDHVSGLPIFQVTRIPSEDLVLHLPDVYTLPETFNLQRLIVPDKMIADLPKQCLNVERGVTFLPEESCFFP